MVEGLLTLVAGSRRVSSRRLRGTGSGVPGAVGSFPRGARRFRRAVPLAEFVVGSRAPGCGGPVSRVFVVGGLGVCPCRLRSLLAVVFPPFGSVSGCIPIIFSSFFWCPVPFGFVLLRFVSFAPPPPFFLELVLLAL